MPHARIIAAAKYLPEKVVTNEDLVEQYGFPHPAWFDRSAAGVKERRFAAPGETTVDMGAAALRALVEQAGLRDKPVDLLLMTTCSFEQAGPSAAMHVAQRVGLRPTLCFDLVGACAAFAAAMDVANQYLSSGAASRVIIVASELQSPHMYFGPDGDHYKFAGIFGDGAGAVLLERSDEVGIEGSARATLPDAVRSVIRTHDKPVPEFPHIPPSRLLYASEGGVQSAYKALPVEVCMRALDLARARVEDIDWLVSHQPQVDMLQSLRTALRIPAERHYVNVERYGNTVSASIPIVLAEMMEADLLKRGQRVLMLGMGAGFMAVAHVLRF